MSPLNRRQAVQVAAGMAAVGFVQAADDDPKFKLEPGVEKEAQGRITSIAETVYFPDESTATLMTIRLSDGASLVLSGDHLKLLARTAAAEKWPVTVTYRVTKFPRRTANMVTTLECAIP